MPRYASTRARSFLRSKRLDLVEGVPEVRKVSIWLDNHLWKPNGYTSIRIATHKRWVIVEFELPEQYWRYVNREWRLAGEARVKLDKRSRQLVLYLVSVKEVGEYEPKGYLPVDVSEDNARILVDGVAYLFESDIEKLVLGCYYRRKRIQEKYDTLYGVKSRAGGLRGSLGRWRKRTTPGGR